MLAYKTEGSSTTNANAGRHLIYHIPRVKFVTDLNSDNVLDLLHPFHCNFS